MRNGKEKIDIEVVIDKNVRCGDGFYFRVMERINKSRPYYIMGTEDVVGIDGFFKSKEAVLLYLKKFIKQLEKEIILKD